MSKYNQIYRPDLYPVKTHQQIDVEDAEEDTLSVSAQDWNVHPPFFVDSGNDEQYLANCNVCHHSVPSSYTRFGTFSPIFPSIIICEGCLADDPRRNLFVLYEDLR